MESYGASNAQQPGRTTNVLTRVFGFNPGARNVSDNTMQLPNQVNHNTGSTNDEQFPISNHAPMTTSILAGFNAQEKKQLLGERLFPLVQEMYPELAGKITGMLLEIDNIEILHMLKSKESLKAKVEEAVQVLQAHQSKAAVVPPSGGAATQYGVNATIIQDKKPYKQRYMPAYRASITQQPRRTTNRMVINPGARNVDADNKQLPSQMNQKTDSTRHMQLRTNNHKPMTASILTGFNAQEKKQLLGERLFPLVHEMYPELAGKITGMLLEMDNMEILHMLKSKESLKAKVEEAVHVIQAHQSKTADTQSLGRVANQYGANATIIQDKTPYKQISMAADEASNVQQPPQKTDKEEDSGICIICFGQESNCAIYRCGHICMCYECAQNLAAKPNPVCPICREVIADVIRVFRS